METDLFLYYQAVWHVKFMVQKRFIKKGHILFKTMHFHFNFLQLSLKVHCLQS